MKYYFMYEILYKDRNGKNGKLKMRADNPKHLIKRFREKYHSRLITNFYPINK